MTTKEHLEIRRVQLESQLRLCELGMRTAKDHKVRQEYTVKVISINNQLARVRDELAREVK